MARMEEKTTKMEKTRKRCPREYDLSAMTEDLPGREEKRGEKRREEKRIIENISLVRFEIS
jgi:hypothetical protein